METPEQIFKKCPELEEIANRLHDSEESTAKINEENSAKRKRLQDESRSTAHIKTLYPEHFCISEIMRNGSWSTTAASPKFGRDAFLKALTTLIETRKPQALKVEIYQGKRATSSPKSFTCYLADEAETTDPEKNNPGLGKVGEEIAILKKKFDDMSGKSEGSSMDVVRMEFKLQLKEIEHKTEVEKIIRDCEAKLERKNDEIDDLHDEIEDLQEQLTELDGELSGAADLINAKQKTPAVQTIIAGALEAAAVNFVKNRPKLLTEAFGLKKEQIAEIFAEENKAVESEGKSESNGAGFADVPNTDDEFAGYDEDHAKALKLLITFAKSLNREQFEILFTINQFACTDDGKLHDEHANKMVAFTYAVKKAEDEKATQTA